MLQKIQSNLNFQLQSSVRDPKDIVNTEFRTIYIVLESMLEGDLRDNFEQYRKGLSEL